MKTKNTYIDFLNETAGSTIFSISEKESLGYYKSGVDIRTPLLDDYFKLYLDTLQYSVEEFVDLFQGHTRFVEVVFGNRFDQAKNKPEWFKLFTPALENDIYFFASAFEVFLEHYSYTDGLRFDAQTSHYLNQRNIDMFQQLVRIGKTHHHFSKFTEKDFYTKNVHYNQILVDENVFSNNFDVNNLITYLADKQANVNNKNKNNHKNKLFFPTYIQDIFNLKNTDILITLKTNNSLFDFIEEFFNHSEKLSKSDKIEFVRFLLADNDAYDYIVNQSSLNHEIAQDIPDIIPIILGNMNVTTKGKLFTHLKLDESTFGSSYSSGLLKWINPLISKTKNDASIDTLNFIFDLLKKTYSHQEKETSAFMGRFMLHYISQQTELFEKKTEENVQRIELLVNSFLNNLEQSINLKQHQPTFTKHIQYLANISSFLEEAKSPIENKLMQKIVNHLKTDVYHYFFDFFNKKSYSSHETFIPNIARFIQKFKNEAVFGILDLLNNDDKKPLWATLVFDIKSPDSTKTLFDSNLPFFLIAATEGKAIRWFLKEANLELFSQTTYKNKNFISYFHKEPWFKMPLITLTEDETALKKLVLENKVSLRVINKLIMEDNYKDMKQLFNFHSLNNKVVEKDEAPKPKRVKI